MFHLRRSLLRRYRLFAPRLLYPGLLLLILLLLLDGIAALRGSQIQEMLTLDTPTPQGAFSLAAAPANDQQTLIANDTFQRPNQSYWGKSSSGQSWQADAQTDPNFTIVHAAGVIHVASACVFCEAVLGPIASNAEVSFQASLSSYSSSTLCAMLRWNGPMNFYKLELNGQNLTLWRVMDGTPTPLQSVLFPARDGTMYTFRLRAVGTRLSAMVWPMDQPAPADWQISLLDSALSTGHAGIGTLIQQDAQVKITAFREVAL